MATVRSLWRWVAWRLTQAESTVDWTDACIWDIPAEDNILDVEPMTIKEIPADDNIFMVPASCPEENC